MGANAVGVNDLAGDCFDVNDGGGITLGVIALCEAEALSVYLRPECR